MSRVVEGKTGADIVFKNKYGLTALHLSVIEGSWHKETSLSY